MGKHATKRGKVIKARGKAKKGTIKIRLIFIPLILVLIATIGIGSISSYTIRKSLLSEMEKSGFDSSQKLLNTMEDHAKSLQALNTTLGDQITMVGKIVLRNEANLNNEFMKALAEDAGFDQVSWYDANGVIQYSNIDNYIGWETSKGHPIYNFWKGDDQQYLEDIRIDTESGQALKYGYFKSPKGAFVQVGILADKIQELTQVFSYQELLENLAADEGVVYALLMNTNYEVIAHSDPKRIGTIFSDKGSKSAIINQEPYSEEAYYAAEGVRLNYITVPAIVGGQQIGAISIGYSMEHVQSAIFNNIMIIVIAGVLAFILLGIVLFTTSNYAINIISKLKDQLGFMASGDFSNHVPKDLLEKK